MVFNFIKYFSVFLISIEILFIFLLMSYGGSFFSTPESKVLRSDIIVILGGGTADRLKTGIELFKKGGSDKLLITGFPDLNQEAMPLYIKWRVQYIIESGISEEFLFFDGTAKSSLEEAVLVKKFLINNNYHKAIIVSDPPHLRRLYYIYSSVFNTNSRLKFSLIASDPLWWNPDKWWMNSHSAQFVLLEIVKLSYFFISHFTNGSKD